MRKCSPHALPLKELFTVPATGPDFSEHLTRVMEMIEAATFDAGDEGMMLSTDRGVPPYGHEPDGKVGKPHQETQSRAEDRDMHKAY
ncbi:MAG: hypothetical protein U5L72_18605 [Bacteroidales bacterium]|nr:hypothetical protein [Bacteroidales bacterium]